MTEMLPVKWFSGTTIPSIIQICKPELHPVMKLNSDQDF